MSPRRATATFSNSAADRAGRMLRAWLPDPGATTDDAIYQAWEVMHVYRALHEYPLVLVTNGLRDLVNRHTAEGGKVSQRYKRVPRMLDKLMRHPHMRLSQMEDIGGCRAILSNEAEMKRVRARIRNNWDVVREYAYDVNPKPATGYRARHIVVRRQTRLIEIQLRTPEQHGWAEMVEQTAARTAFNLKDGIGPAELVEFFQLASEIIALQERGEWVDSEENRARRARWDALTPLVGVYFEDESE